MLLIADRGFYSYPLWTAAAATGAHLPARPRPAAARPHPGPRPPGTWACLVIYQAIRAIIARTAAGARLDPDRISFTATLHAARRTIPTARDHVDTTLASTETEILTTLVPERDGRIYPRAVSKPISPYPSKRTRPGPVSQHAQYTLTTTTPATPASTHTSQDKHP